MIEFVIKNDYTPIYFTEHLSEVIDVSFGVWCENVSIFVDSPQMFVVPSDSFICGTDVCGRIIYL